MMGEMLLPPMMMTVVMTPTMAVTAPETLAEVCCVPGTVLRSLHSYQHIQPSQGPQEAIIISILQVWKLRHIEVRSPVQSHRS